MSDFRLGIKLRIFNYNLDKGLRATGKTRVQAAKELGISVPTLYHYLSFKSYPTLERQLKIAIYCGTTIEALFPEQIAGVRLEKQPEAISFTEEEAVASGLIREAGLESSGEFLKESIRKVLDMIPPEQAQIVSLRFGLEDGVERTLNEIGEVMGVSGERVRQIEVKALRKLRHPVRAKYLRDYIT